MARSRISPGLVSAAFVAVVVACLVSVADAGPNWPEWRGPLRTGEGPAADPPLEWAEGKNVRWKLDVPGLGHGSPIVWGELVVVTTAVPSAKDPKALEFVVIAVERKDGTQRWRTVVHEEVPHEGIHQTNSYASASLLTDGKRLYAYFGSRGLYALDMNGKRLWEKQLGKMQTRNGFGEGASPALHGETLVVTWDHEGPDFVVALDAATGKERWRKDRDEPTTWATPLVITGEGAPQVVVSGTNRVVSYDLATGEERWRAGGLTTNAIPSPVYADGVVYVTSGFRGSALQAIRLKDAKGEVTAAPALVFRYDRDTPYVPSPLLYRGQLYFLKSNSGVITSLDAKDGSVRFSERLEAVPNVYASPVGAAGRVYVAGRDGGVVVLAAGPKLELLATNRLDDGFDASPAVVGREIYLRGRKHLYRISAD
jgi:outer membrane protein assembly factor BamB